MAKNGIEGITLKQTKAIDALVSTPTVGEAAKMAGIGARTLYRWMAEDENFKAALNEAESNAISALARGLLALSERVLSALGDSLSSNDENVVMRAVNTHLSHLPKLRQISALEERLSEIEKRLEEIGHGGHAG